MVDAPGSQEPYNNTLIHIYWTTRSIRAIDVDIDDHIIKDAGRNS